MYNLIKIEKEFQTTVSMGCYSDNPDTSSCYLIMCSLIFFNFSMLMMRETTARKKIYRLFFQRRHFNFVVDILAPYINAHRFNVYIVVAACRTLMRWYTQMSDSIRPIMSNYIMETVLACYSCVYVPYLNFEGLLSKVGKLFNVKR